jgi:energy-coupling factor transporter ATP-binding protein EcfA2
MSAWDAYPDNYREHEVGLLLSYIRAGECAAVIGLSGSGKSNLLGFIANRLAPSDSSIKFVMVDCNRLGDPSRGAFFRMLRLAIVGAQSPENMSADEDLFVLEESLGSLLGGNNPACFLLDRFDALYVLADFQVLASNLRYLRDRFKYKLTYLIGARRPVDGRTELAELFFGHTIWLGPLSRNDALWSAKRDGQRFAGLRQVDWSEQVLEKLVDLSWGYPALLRAVCEAYGDGTQPELIPMSQHPAVARRVAEFWADAPSMEMVKQAGLSGQPLLQLKMPARSRIELDLTELTAKEHLLLEYLRHRADEVCTKDELIQAVWPEDVIYEQGVRDESLAQLVRRLRVKIETNPNEPHFIQTIPGRGYLFRS